MRARRAAEGHGGVGGCMRQFHGQSMWVGGVAEGVTESDGAGHRFRITDNPCGRWGTEVHGEDQKCADQYDG